MIRPSMTSAAVIIPSPRLRWGGLGWGAVPLGATLEGVPSPAFRPPTPTLPTAGGGREFAGVRHP